MSFKQVALAGLVAVVAATPAPSTQEVLKAAVKQRAMAIAGVDPVISAIGGVEGKSTGTYAWTQVSFEDENGTECEKAIALKYQGVACMLFRLDPENNNELLTVEGNPKGLYGSVKSGDGNEWEFTKPDTQSLDWYTEESMNVNEENIFTFRIGSDDVDGFWPTFDVSKKLLESTVAEDSRDGRVAVFHFGPKSFDDEYSLLCGYAAVPTCPLN
eukprot:Clim_evm1s192 gene=Clim_evmTU1s192